MLEGYRHVGEVQENSVMKILIFGATGMVGQGVLRECLLAADVEKVTAVGRTPLTQTDPKLHQVLLADVYQPQLIEEQLAGYEACFFCLGVSSSGKSEAVYRRETYDMTLGVAKLLASQSPNMTFTYVSGAGTDSSEKGSTMWARVKGRTENDLQKLPFASVYLFRPGIIVPLHGIESKTASYRIFYRWTKPLLNFGRKLFPNHVITTEILGNAMLNAARGEKGRFVLESKDIAQLAKFAHNNDVSSRH